MGGDDEAEDGVTQELQALVRLLTRMLGTPRPMRYGPEEQGRVVELPPQQAAEPLRRRKVAQSADASPTRPTT